MSVSYLKMKLSQTLAKPGFYVLLFALLYAVVCKDPNVAFFWASVFYGLIIINRRTNIKKTASEISLFDPSIPEVIDSVITEAFNQYIVLNEGYKDKEYVSEEDEKKIITVLIENVLTRMSKTMLAKIRAYYNEELAEQVLTEKIYMVVMNYSINNNMIEESNNLELESERKRKQNLTPIL